MKRKILGDHDEFEDDYMVAGDCEIVAGHDVAGEFERAKYNYLHRYINIANIDYKDGDVFATTYDGKLFVIPKKELNVDLNKIGEGIRSILVKIKWADEFLK